ncbi:M15 family metallopeptidase [Thalassotalea sp. 1_MG-2023]|uniref:M15 family metallopeptidase n=1 Tax=Thalassotalea sp. 1_MG-2023 TaxID=3062680 RepID=UPI0026E11C21|nr:M15 family metallopeptidase [Thalassotalea sp. 1_MG-2023]MDO6427735.1 M15 family metallopeptidase [Thalassotalea sp. 1_MG-2023]
MATHGLLTGTTNTHIHYLSENKGIHQGIITPWLRLVDAAQTAGFQLSIASGFRDFDRQLNIWNRKMTGELPVFDLQQQQINLTTLTTEEKVHAIMTFSALPGASRHHWGTDVDIYDPSQLNNGQQLLLEEWEYQGNGPFAKLTKWLNENAQHYGFYFPYQCYQGGVAHEPWHLSYAPLSTQFLTELTPEILASTLHKHEIEGKAFILDQIEQLMERYVYNVQEVTNG